MAFLHTGFLSAVLGYCPTLRLSADISGYHSASSASGDVCVSSSPLWKYYPDVLPNAGDSWAALTASKEHPQPRRRPTLDTVNTEALGRGWID